MDFSSFVTPVPDFPIPGVLFRDISPLLASPKMFTATVAKLAELVSMHEVDFVAGIESRGFILAAALASKFNKGFIPIRKQGKLPPPVIRRSYELEYGQATIEMASGSGRLLIVDDVLATGGTLRAAIDLATASGYQVTDVGVLINLRFLNKMKFDGREISSLIQYES